MESGDRMGVRNNGHAKAGTKIAPRTKTANGSKLSVASFFSGIGGFDLGFERAGFKVVYQCEINKFCRSILQKHWSNIEPEQNIKEITDGSSIPDANVWVGGFPCQDVSLARMGPRAGLKGKQSGLFHEFSRLVEQRIPRIVLIENVPGLLSSHEGRDFAIVIRTLAELGYSVGWRVLNSKNFGVPQSRQRVFIVGCYGEGKGPAEILFESECSGGDTSSCEANGKRTISPFKESVGDLIKGPIVKKLAHCLYACSARHTGTDWSRNYASYPDGQVRRLVPIECERLQGFPEDWTIPIDAKFLNADDLDSMRYYALGNAVTVPVAEWLAGRIQKFLTKNRSRVKQLMQTA
jgi:DNA (cytosine-5)-methyltransferase 1